MSGTDEEKGRDLSELREAFEAWAADHGVVWFATDVRLAKAIGRVVGLDVVFPPEA